jgi:antitoxin (DNA-binding transcriptional repressor) of toxin-antitoxin stability system
MRTVSAMELRAKLGKILDLASSGERIIIERDHRAVAALVTPEDAERLDGSSEDVRDRTDAALERLDRFVERTAGKYPEPDDGFEDSAAWIRWDRDHGHEPGG